MINEKKKIIRTFILITVWVVFCTATVAGMMTAGARTERVMSGNIQILMSTSKYNLKEKTVVI